MTTWAANYTHQYLRSLTLLEIEKGVVNADLRFRQGECRGDRVLARGVGASFEEVDINTLASA